MLHDIHNPTRATRIVYDVAGREVRVPPGGSASGVDLPQELVQSLRRSTGDLVLTRDWVEEEREREAVEKKQPITGSVVVDGMWGIGDNIHQRAVMRELMKTENVWLTTCHWHVYHDLIARGLNLDFKATKLRAQAKTIQRERDIFRPAALPPPAARRIKLWYRKDQIDVYGSILQAMAGTCGVDHTKPLDFSLPVPREWNDHVPPIDTGGKPLLVYRPVVLRREWNSANRNPDPAAYRALFDVVREKFFVVSVADLQPGEEWIVGPEAPADLKLHRGELDFQGMASLWRRADLVFCNAGFGPVLAQAVGTPVIVVYGGRESYATTQRAGAHLAPTLGIDPIKPCDCHTEKHDCGDKRIDVPRALERVAEFLGPKSAEIRARHFIDRGRSDTLIFATTYVDNRDRQHLTEMWLELTHRLNPDADLLLVDSASPMPVVSEEFKRNAPPFDLFDFGDNIGHLSRKGRDGWGRAFCKGLDLALERGYRWAVHIEGDSLLRVPVGPTLREMGNFGCATTPVKGTGGGRDIASWVETGLMFFTTEYLRKSKFTERYNWPARTEKPTPEKIIFHQLRGDVKMLSLKALRSDKKQITRDTVVGMDLDWITHCHDDAWCYDRFFEAAMERAKEVMPNALATRASNVETPTAPGLMLNLGCGDNRLPGWENHDIDVDITKPLPWAERSADYIVIEHCVEHVGYKQAITFFEEALRVLRPGGVLRVTVPSVEQVWASSDADYWKFAAKWGGEASRRGATRAILFAHGHEMAWTESLMGTLLRYAGFPHVERVQTGKSRHRHLVGVEGHGKVIGDRFNLIESMTFEATRSHEGASLARSSAWGVVQEPQAPISVQAVTVASSVAIIVGGAKDVMADLDAANGLLVDAQMAGRAEYLVINDMIPRFRGPCRAVTLHPQKVGTWLRERQAAGLVAPSQVWAHSRGSRARPFADITHVTDDWRGSSGLFAVKIARQIGFTKIILAGVPMRAEDGHFVRGQDWRAAASFKLAWTARKSEIAPYVKSMSGWTADQFGRPDEDFIRGGATVR